MNPPSIVLNLANVKWGFPARPETINGINHDCVIKVKDNYWIIIEITKERTLDKLRGDANRLNLTRSYLFSQEIFADCYFICEDLSPISSLRESCSGLRIKIYSFDEFATELYDYDLYKNKRKEKNFGSDQNRDSIDYVQVKYNGKNQIYSIADFCTTLTTGRNVILLGDFGTGKSRCIRELFNMLNNSDITKSKFYPLAINLRDVWGARTYEDIVSIHLRALGLSSLSEPTFRLTENNNLLFLLDGFDEIGTQSWGADSSEVKAAKMASLAGVRDIAAKKKKGIFIVGREHYFDSDDEMFECLGLNPTQTTICNCQAEFSENEISAYLSQVGINIQYPKWLPKKPLLCEYINSLGSDKIQSLLLGDHGEPTFWCHFIDKITDRDSEISTALPRGSIKKVLIELARIVRSKTDQMNPLSVFEIKQAFQKCVGRTATSDSEIMLQRLPGLGRFDSQSDERKFVDRYLIDGLVAEDIARIIKNVDTECFDENWLNEASEKSVSYASSFTNDEQQAIYSLIKKIDKSKNTILKGDLLHTLLCCDNGNDFKGLKVSETCFSKVDISDRNIKNLTIEDSTFEELNILKTTSDHFIIKDCVINKIIGISSISSRPAWIKEGTISSCAELQTKKSIRKQETLSLYQKHLLEIIQKLFFQAGVSRSEKAMFKQKNAEDYKAIRDILLYLSNEKIISINIGAGKDGTLYKPNRKNTKRMQKIKDELHHSQDDIWIKVTQMGQCAHS